MAAAARRMTGFELEFSKFPLQERRTAPGEVLILGQHMPDDDRELARGRHSSDMFAALVSDLDEECTQRAGCARDNPGRFDEH